MVSRETQPKRYSVQRFECVGADISRPKANERELYSRTAQSRYTAGRQIAAPYGLRSFWLVPLNALLSIWQRCGRLVAAPTGERPHSPHPLRKSHCGSPLQSALRAASFPRGKLWRLQKLSPLNVLLSKWRRCGATGCRPLRTQRLLAASTQLTAQAR